MRGLCSVSKQRGLIPFGKIFKNMIHATVLSAIVWRINIHDVALHTLGKHIGILVVNINSLIALGVNHAHLKVLELFGVLAISLKLSRSVGNTVGTVYQRCNKHKIFLLRKLTLSSLDLIPYIANLFGCRHAKILVAIII